MASARLTRQAYFLCLTRLLIAGGAGATDPNADGGAATGGSATAGNSAAENAAASSRTSKGCTLSLGTPRSGSSLVTLLALGTCALLARRQVSSLRLRIASDRILR